MRGEEVGMRGMGGESDLTDLTSLVAASTFILFWIIRWAMTAVADRLAPTLQCTSILPPANKTK